MPLLSRPSWELQIGESERSFSSIDELRTRIAATESMAIGKMSLCADAGARPLWKRILGAKRYTEFFFALEWFEQYASLIFLDEDASEYRAIDHQHPVSAPENARLKIAHGELRPHPSNECMSKARAFYAIAEYLQTGDRPAWLKYNIVR
jgi:hypothetical protein